MFQAITALLQYNTIDHLRNNLVNVMQLPLADNNYFSDLSLQIFRIPHRPTILNQLIKHCCLLLMTWSFDTSSSIKFVARRRLRLQQQHPQQQQQQHCSASQPPCRPATIAQPEEFAHSNNRPNNESNSRQQISRVVRITGCRHWPTRRRRSSRWPPPVAIQSQALRSARLPLQPPDADSSSAAAAQRTVRLRSSVIGHRTAFRHRG